MKPLFFLLLALFNMLPNAASAEIIGSVDTNFQLLARDDDIVIEAFDDPKVQGVACHLSRARRGGVKGSLGLAEDTSDASIACRQIGPIRMDEKMQDKETVFSQKTSLLFKKMQVVRFLDKKRNVLVYLVYSDKLVDGSPKNSISSVPIMPWGKP
ncbi:CreA family protein [Candidatus Magnetaquicoccus inordinatus]|uniref:CreA family protein n=1 Tax=Candidatus Magnetaquicoccus inordinatus TaxID=2496818 RepID=UPI00102B0FB0|nr:CreA family protein [Candidatus Magnetaquicoccus inordinatus]